MLSSSTLRAQPRASHFLDGQYCEDESGAPLVSRYPATAEVIARLHCASAAILERALSTAHRAQLAWAQQSEPARGRILQRAAHLLRERNRSLSELETLDTGKPLQETLCADAASAADCLEYFGGLCVARGLQGRHIPLNDAGVGTYAYTKREPLGLCVGLGAWNYPIQTAAWKVAPALACGNAMVFKPSELTPLSALALAEILHEAGLPSGVLNVIQGAGAIGEALISDPRVAKISLTGSVETGRKVAACAGRMLKKVTLELGGKSPLLIFADADLDEAVSGTLLANFYSSGQVCSNGTRVFVERSIRERFTEKLIARTKAIRIGDPLDEHTQLGPLASAEQRARVLAYIESGKKEAELVYGGREVKVAGFESGYFVEPTIFTGVEDDATIAREEIFGPVLCLFDFDSEAEAIERGNSTPFGLSAGVFTRDIERGARVVDALQAGTCWINSYNLTATAVPFGGNKHSGIGRENSLESIEAYTQVKSVYVQAGKIDSPY